MVGAQIQILPTNIKSEPQSPTDVIMDDAAVDPTPPPPIATTSSTTTSTPPPPIHLPPAMSLPARPPQGQPATQPEAAASTQASSPHPAHLLKYPDLCHHPRFDLRALQQALAGYIIDDSITNTLIVQGPAGKVKKIIFR